MCHRREHRRRLTLALCALQGAAVATAHADPEAGAPASYTTVVRAPGGPPQPVSAAVEGEQARHLPGTGGDPALAAVDLPGVARPAPGATGLVVWGASPAETRVLFDGVEIPALYHLGGFRSTVGAELVGRIEVVPGAYGADYGRALGGLVRVESRPADGQGAHLLLDANLLDVSASVRARVLPRLWVAVAARTSVLDLTYGRLAPRSTTALFPIPRYSDGQLEATLDVAPRATLRALVLASRDQVERDLDGATPGLPDRIERQQQSWWRAALFYDERGEDDGLGATLFAGGDRTALDQQLGSVPASQAVSAAEVGLRARYRARLGEGFRLGLGLDGLLQRARVRRAGSLTVPAREGDVTVFAQPPGDDVNADTWSATVGDIGPFVTASLTRGAWTFTPGLRADAFPVDGSRVLPPVGATPVSGYARVAWALDPRLAVAYALSPALILTTAAGVYHQPVDPADLSAVFGSPALNPARAVHGTLSVWARLGEHGSVETTGFYRRLDGLAVRSPLTTPVLAGALTPDGRGQSLGVELVARRELARGTLAWVTYTLSRSERWVAGGPVRLLDFDQTHVLTAVGSHQRGAWALSGRVRYATGMPHTPVIGSFVDIRDGVFQPLLGAQNSVRLPAFFQGDARVDRTLAAGPVAVTVYLDVQNVTARRNPEEIVYTHDFTASGFLTGPPLLVLLGVRIES
jgi:TonB dependent receptor/TonB-dependent Receptor Plug Domain